MGAIIRAPRGRILAASSVAVTAAADTNENTLATIAVPAGGMGLNGLLRYRFRFSQTNNANAKTARLRFSGAAGTDFITGQSLASNAAFQFTGNIANLNATNSQKGQVEAQGATTLFVGPAVTAAVDTTATTTLLITAQKGTAGDTITLESYLVELILP